MHHLAPRWLILGAAPLLALPPHATGQSCEGGREPRPDLGVGTFYCRGGTCRMRGASVVYEGEEARAAGRTNYDFSVEPSLWRIRDAGPAAGRIQEGDVLVAVNGQPVTSSAGSRELDGMEAGRAVTLTLRRDGRLLDVAITPILTCEPAGLAAGSGPRPGRRMLEGGRIRAEALPVVELQRRQAYLVELERLRATLAMRAASLDSLHPMVEVRRVWPGALGIGLGCADCDLGPPWRFDDEPVVIAVEADSPAARAGLRPGDVLTHVNGLAVTSSAGARRLAALEPGEKVEFRFTRGGAPRAAVISVSLEEP